MGLEEASVSVADAAARRLRGGCCGLIVIAFVVLIGLAILRRAFWVL